MRMSSKMLLVGKNMSRVPRCTAVSTFGLHRPLPYTPLQTTRRVFSLGAMRMP